MTPYRVRYQTVEIGGFDVHLKTLRDLGEFADDRGDAARLGIDRASWPLFGVLWPSSLVLAYHLLGLDIEGLRILEVGCGLGLASLVLGMRHADITATDHHPEVRTFLDDNAALNGIDPIPYLCCDWCGDGDDLGSFDLIVGSDLLYLPGHAELLSGFIDRHARAGCEVILVGPGRREQARFDQHMTDLGYLHSRQAPSTDFPLDEPFRGRLHHYRRADPAGRHPHPVRG